MGCRPSLPIEPPPSFSPSSQSPSGISAVSNVDDIARGHLLIELHPGVALRELFAQTGDALPATVASGAIKPVSGIEEDGGVYQIGGVALVLVRPIAIDGVSSDAASGPIYLFRLTTADLDGQATAAGLRQVTADARVRRVEYDRVRHMTTVPNDPLFSEQWNLTAIHLQNAWALASASTDVVVAVLDTGIVFGHPDLAGRLVPGYDFISTPDSAADGDTHRDADPTDTGGVDSSRLHGTHVAGIIGAATNNGIGIAGVDPHCRIMPVRVLGINGGDGLDSDIADAVRWSSGLPIENLPPPNPAADVLNLSFGGPTVSFTLQRAIDQALARGVLVVVAAGNGSVDVETFSPGGLDSVISVGAAGSSGARADYSNFGTRVDLLAPGGDNSYDDAGNPEGVLSTYRDEGQFENPAVPLYSYYALSGTSQASPHVAAAASLARALWPELRQAGLAALLAQSADSKFRCDRDPLAGCGAGLLDVEALLKQIKVQLGCGCTDGKICLDGATCASPPSLHMPHFQDNTLRSGACAVAGPVAGGRGPWLLLFGLGALWTLRRGRLARRDPEGTAI